MEKETSCSEMEAIAYFNRSFPNHVLKSRDGLAEVPRGKAEGLIGHKVTTHDSYRDKEVEIILFRRDSGRFGKILL